MMPARLHVAAMTAEERAKHALRKRLGDPSMRPSCCGPRPESFQEGVKVEDIEELSGILERTSTISMGYSPFYCCKVCGQEWYQDWEQLEFGGRTHVRKAT